MIATRAARAGCVFTVAPRRRATTVTPELLRGLVEIRLRHALRMMNDPRANCLPSASNGSSADLEVGLREAIAQRRERVVGVVVDREHASPCRSRRRARGRRPSRAPSARRAPSRPSRARPARRTLRGTSSRCRRTGSSADRSAPSTGSRAARRRCASTAGPCARCTSRPGTCASRSSSARSSTCRRRGRVLHRRAPPRRARATRRARVTVNGAVAREISTRCFCRTRSSSACAPGRRSSAGSTYAAGPSAFAFVTDRLLFS